MNHAQTALDWLKMQADRPTPSQQFVTLVTDPIQLPPDFGGDIILTGLENLVHLRLEDTGEVSLTSLDAAIERVRRINLPDGSIQFALDMRAVPESILSRLPEV